MTLSVKRPVKRPLLILPFDVKSDFAGNDVSSIT